MSSKLSTMPNIPIPLSRFHQDFNHSFSMFHGDVVPVDCFEVIPGDKFSYNPAELVRMSTPTVPIMGNIECYLHAVFIPLRLIWDDAEKFYGDPSNHDTISSITPVDPTTILIPGLSYNYLNRGGSPLAFKHSVSDYLGKQDINAAFTAASMNASAITAWINTNSISCLKERAYCVAWNDHFRPSLMVPPVLVNKGSSDVNGSRVGSESFTTGSAVSLKYGFKPFKCFKKYDYFTANTLSPQFGSSVALPLGTSADIMMKTPTLASGETSGLLASFAADTYPRNLSTDGIRLNYPGNPGSTSGSVQLYADLQNATAATVNQLRYAFQVQKYLERSNYGSKFFEILNAHYGVTNPDLRLQRSQRLGSHKFYINVSQVLSTNESSTVNLGETGAVSVTGDKCSLFTAKFDEPGYVMVLMCTKYDRNYSSGFLREDLKSNRFEFYSPEFANLGDQSTMKLELALKDSSNTLYSFADKFGFQEHWAEYRYRKNIVSGELKVGQGLDVWTLADDFESVAAADLVPGYGFLKEDRDALSRCLLTGSAGPDYIVDYRADIIATREMPLYSIPGLIDHFGAL